MNNGDQQEAEPDSGFTGTVTVNGQKEGITLHRLFGVNSRLDGIGQDSNGEVSITGTFSENDVVLTCRYRSEQHLPRKYTGARHADMAISG